MTRKNIIKIVYIGIFFALILLSLLLYKSINAKESIYTQKQLPSDTTHEAHESGLLNIKLSSSDITSLYETDDWISIEMLEGTKTHSISLKKGNKENEAYRIKIGDELYTLYKINDETIKKIILIDVFKHYGVEGSSAMFINLSFNEVDMGKYILEKAIYKQERDSEGNYYITLENDTMLIRQIKYEIDSQFLTAINSFNLESTAKYLAISKLMTNNYIIDTIFFYDTKHEKLSPYITIDSCPDFINETDNANSNNQLDRLYSYHNEVRDNVDAIIMEITENDNMIDMIRKDFEKYTDLFKPNTIVDDIEDVFNKNITVLANSIKEYRDKCNNERRYRLKYDLDGQWKYLEASHAGGFYTEQFQLKLDTYKDCTIYYTLDGSYPTNQNLLYEKPIIIRDRMGETDILPLINKTSLDWKRPKKESFKGTVVRSIVYHNDVPVSDVMTNTYFIDSDIYNRYSMPVVSLVTDKENLFDTNKGIYVLGRRRNNWLRKNPGKPINNGTSANYMARGSEWERPIHIEWYEQNGNLGFSQNLGVRINGGWSRSYPMKPLRLYARSEYDNNKNIKYEIFDNLYDADGNTIEKYKTFLLRNSGHDFLYTMFEDSMIQSLMKGTHVNTQAYKPVIVFINGEYWGIHNARERQDEEYLESHYNVDEDEIILMENRYKLVHGNEGDENRYLDMINYLKTNDIKDEETYNYIQTKMDIDNFIDYHILELYIANLDWQGNNVKYWSKKTDGYVEDAPYGHDGKWRWLLFDTEAGFKYYDYNMIVRATEAGNHTGLNADWATFLLRTLLKNTEFKTKFLRRYADLLNTNFREGKVISKINEMKANIEPMMEEHINRWSYPSSLEKWDNNIDELREFAAKRPSIARRHLVNYFGVETVKGVFSLSDNQGGYIEVNGIKLDISNQEPFTAFYFKGIPLHIKVIVNDGYEFTGFEGNEGNNKQIAITPDEKFTLQVNIHKLEK